MSIINLVSIYNAIFDYFYTNSIPAIGVGIDREINLCVEYTKSSFRENAIFDFWTNHIRVVSHYTSPK